MKNTCILALTDTVDDILQRNLAFPLLRLGQNLHNQCRTRNIRLKNIIAMGLIEILD